jgi:predicted TIM-barrel fold metal-dependent hydrolase
VANESADKIGVIDLCANFWTPEWINMKPPWGRTFFPSKLRVDPAIINGVEAEELVERMDAAGVERVLMIAGKCGRLGLPGAYHTPYDMVARFVEKFPDRFSALAGIDPFEGMTGVRVMEDAIKNMGFVGAHVYPHWFELAPDHAKYYPFYAKCCELDVPIQIHVGQSMVYERSNPCRSVARPITLDAVACDFQELTIIGIHIGVPWTEEMLAMSWKHDRVYIGTDAHSPRYWPKPLIHYLNTFGQDKVLFGTDFPVLDFGKAIEQVNELEIRPEAYAKLMRDNAKRIYKL